MEKERKRKRATDRKFVFSKPVSVKLDPRRKNFNLALPSEKEDSSSSFLFFDVFADRKTRSK